MFSAGCFGPKLTGKTTFIKSLSRDYWKQKGIKSIVLDPNGDADWGTQAWVTRSEEKFWPVVWNSQGCLVIVEEAAATISRNRDLIPVFTRLRHNKHRLLVVGHNGADLLPTMRQQFDTLYLFRQSPGAAEVWVETFADSRIMECCNLQKYEILKCTMFQKPERIILQKGSF